jgi:hypothetical protein
MTKHDAGEWLIGLQEPEVSETGTIILTNTLVNIYVNSNSVPSGKTTIALIGHNGNQNVNENAKRIVECVNSMNGIDEPLKPMTKFNNIKRMLVLMTEQNELLHKALDITLNPDKYSSEEELHTIMKGIESSFIMMEEIKNMKQ